MDKKERSFNLCSIYILPLIGLNRWSFGATTDNFVSSYIDENNIHIVVELLGPITTIISNHPNYRFGYTKEGHTFAVFETPREFRSDITKFRDGQYSQFSDRAKQTIKKKSGLKYKVPRVGGKVETAVELAALDKDPDLRKHLEDTLAVKLPKDAELASIPGGDNFIELQLVEH